MAKLPYAFGVAALMGLMVALGAISAEHPEVTAAGKPHQPDLEYLKSVNSVGHHKLAEAALAVGVTAASVVVFQLAMLAG